MPLVPIISISKEEQLPLYSTRFSFMNMENITEKNTKAEIIAAAVPLIDDQAEKIVELQEKYHSLLWITGVVAIWATLF